MNELYVKLAEILDVETVSLDDRFEDFEMWDSLSKLATIAMLDASFGVTVSGRELSELNVISDLQTLLENRKKA